MHVHRSAKNLKYNILPYNNTSIDNCNFKKAPKPLIGGHLPVGLSSVAQPLLLKVRLQDLGAPFARQTSLLQAQLAHLHVVDAGHQQNRRLVLVQLHLAGHVLAVKVGVPPAALGWKWGEIIIIKENA